MADKLSDQQRQVVEDRGGALLVSAAAGSGKTRVLIERVLKYITEPNSEVNIDDFLMITYTKAAASELRAKIAKALTGRIAEDPGNMRLQQQFQRLYLAKISTVHSFCTDVLREFAYMLDIPADFRMIESKEDIPLRMQVIDKLLGERYDHLGEDPDFAAFVDSQGVGRDDSRVPDLILKVYDSAKCHMDSDGWLKKCLDDTSVLHTREPAETVWGRYLMDDASMQADDHLKMVESVLTLCMASPGLERMAEVLQQMAAQLITIRDATSWDALHSVGSIDDGNIRGIAQKKGIDKAVYKEAAYVRSACKKRMDKVLSRFGNDAHQVMEDLRLCTAPARGLVELVRQFSVRYDRLKRNLRVMDFSDLEHKALDLLVGKSRSGPTAVANQVGERFCEIMVDDYQDSNEVQDAIFSALTNRRNNLFMVGDVKQSIYQFRLADPRIFLDKYNRFAFAGEAADGQGRKIVLSNNFRSSKAVIDGVNAVFRQCMSRQVGDLDYGDAEALVEGVPHPPLDEPSVELHVIEAGSDVYLQEAEFTARRILELLDGTHMVRDGDAFRPIRPDDIAILLRSPKTNGWFFQYALEKVGLRVVSSVNVDLLQTDEVQWLRSMLQTINNPRQDISLLAAITGPVFGFSADELAAIRVKDREVSFYDGMVASDMPKCASFVALLDQLRHCARIRTLPELVETIFELTQADAVYAAMDDTGERSSNLQDFYQFVVKFSATPGADLAQLLQHLQQSEEDGLRVERQASHAGCIRMTTIHKSKGLEYPVVFLCGLSKSFNLSDSYEKLLCDDKLGLGLSCIDPLTRLRYPSVAQTAIAAKMVSDTVSEELRVLYVAMTRPQDRLIMTYCVKDPSKELSDLSVAMDHAPSQLLCREAMCMGDWVLYTAMQRTDAGQLFVNSRQPSNTHVCDDVWKIAYHPYQEPEEPTSVVDEVTFEGTIGPADMETIRCALDFCYPYQAATVTPSKQTATQKKGRVKDQEVSEDAPAPKRYAHIWRKPSFVDPMFDGRAIGNATHALMQYIQFGWCGDEEGIRSEIQRLVACGFLTDEQAKLIDVANVLSFFNTELGRKLRSGGEVLREFKFSILEDASDYVSGLSGETVLLQGVVDCALIESDGITVVDFKTDRVAADTVMETAEKYRTQVQTYAEALSRIFEQRIKAKALYFFAAQQLVWL